MCNSLLSQIYEVGYIHGKSNFIGDVGDTKFVNPFQKNINNNNVSGFLNILETCKELNINKIIYASSSSVYGSNKNMPLNENEKCDNYFP